VVKTSGVFFHQGELKQAIRDLGNVAMAELRIEPKGKYAGAVHVVVDGHVLGSLPHGTGEDYHGVIAELHEQGQPATCRAELEMHGETFNVWLTLKPELRPADDPFLPPLAEVPLVLYDGQAEALDESLKSRAQNKKASRLGILAASGDDWIVDCEGEWIGALPHGRYSTLNEALSAGMPLTCRVDVRRVADRPLQVEAGLPARATA
jgi:hypothetical protein